MPEPCPHVLQLAARCDDFEGVSRPYLSTIDVRKRATGNEVNNLLLHPTHDHGEEQALRGRRARIACPNHWGPVIDNMARHQSASVLAFPHDPRPRHAI